MSEAPPPYVTTTTGATDVRMIARGSTIYRIVECYEQALREWKHHRRQMMIVITESGQVEIYEGKPRGRIIP